MGPGSCPGDRIGIAWLRATCGECRSRAFRRAEVQELGRLGIYGFGGSAHLTAQVAIVQGIEVHAVTRSAAARVLALGLGAVSATSHRHRHRPPVPLDSAILFAPVGQLVPAALAALDRDGTPAVAGIHLSDVPPLVYQDHLFRERQIRSVTANTRTDAREFLEFAGRHRLEVTTVPCALAEVDRALLDLAAGRVTSVAVLHAR